MVSLILWPNVVLIPHRTPPKWAGLQQVTVQETRIKQIFKTTLLL